MNAIDHIREDMPPPAEQGRGAWRRRGFELAAAVLGIGGGVAFAEPVLAAAGTAWNGYLIPAYQAILENGLLAWCF